jgi:hypothetical protein
VGDWKKRANRFMCEVPKCPRNSVGFGRKDHLFNHVRKRHPDIEINDNAGSFDLT